MFLPFKKRLKYKFVDYKQNKNKCVFLDSIKLFIVSTILGATVYNLAYTTIICLFVILLTQMFAILLTTEIFKPQLFSSQATRVRTRLTEFLLLIVCFVLAFYIPKQTVL